MHAGDALWFLHAGLTYFEKQQCPQPVIEHLRTCARIIGEHILVLEPDPVAVDNMLVYLQSLAGQPAVAAPEPRRTGGKWSAPDRLDAALALLDTMVGSDLVEWDEIVTDIHGTLHGDSPFITDKQFRAIVNIARKGRYEDDTEFWDEFFYEHPEAAAFAQRCADNA